MKKGNTVRKEEEEDVDVHPQDIMLAPSDEEDRDYESATKSDAVTKFLSLEYRGRV